MAPPTREREGCEKEGQMEGALEHWKEHLKQGFVAAYTHTHSDAQNFNTVQCKLDLHLSSWFLGSWVRGKVKA